MTPPQPPPRLEEILTEGWKEYLERDYLEAHGLFTRAVSEHDTSASAWVSLAWSAARLDSLALGENHARTSLARRVQADGWVALGLIASAAGRDSLALWALEHAIPSTYVFWWDRSLDSRDVLFTRAVSLFNLGRYPECLGLVLVLDPAAEVDLLAFDFREQLLQALERISR